MRLTDGKLVQFDALQQRKNTKYCLLCPQHIQNIEICARCYTATFSDIGFNIP